MRRFLILPALVAACTDPSSADDTGASSTIVLDGERLWLTSPDDDAFVAVDRESLEERARIPVRGEPTHVAVFGDGFAVTLARSNSLAFVTEGAAPRYVPIDCDGSHGIVAAGDALIVSCPANDRVLRVDASGVLETHVIAGGPASLAYADDTLFVAARRTGVLHVGVGARRNFDAEWRAQPLEEYAGFAARLFAALAATGAGGVVGVYQRVDRDSDRARPPASGGYGSVVDGQPRIEPRVLSRCGGRYARFDGGARVFSGPSAIASSAEHLWVVNQYTGNVARFRCRSGGVPSPSHATIANVESYRVGRGARGIALAENGNAAWVDVGFDHAVARIDVGGAREARSQTRPLGETSMSDAALRGRAIFHDAEDTHLTPSGVVTCATCHPGGGDDNLVWFLHARGVARKLRRTPPAWGARAPFAPYHWDGEFGDADTLTRSTIVGLLEGDGLLIDYSALSAYMAELPLPYRRPSEEPAGAQAFTDAGCAECHPGGGSDGVLHPADPSADPDGALTFVNTPPLFGVGTRAPYLHDGRAESLDALLFGRAPHGDGTALSAEARDALVAYLNAL
ncbi:MAG: hypothetical protein AAF645_10040 [Myxococcota bacterium]